MRSITALPVLGLLLMPLQANGACNGVSRRPITDSTAMDLMENQFSWG